jgi:hypothetical protein
MHALALTDSGEVLEWGDSVSMPAFVKFPAHTPLFCIVQSVGDDSDVRS